jgi:hypothetical protein
LHWFGSLAHAVPSSWPGGRNIKPSTTEPSRCRLSRLRWVISNLVSSLIIPGHLVLRPQYWTNRNN